MKLTKSKIVSIRKYTLDNDYVYDIGMGGNFPFQIYNESKTTDESTEDLKMLLSSKPLEFTDGEMSITLSPKTKVLIKDTTGKTRVIRAYSVDGSMEIIDWETRAFNNETDL